MLNDIKDKKVCDIGSGMGRIVRNLIQAGASNVTAVEPSEAAFEVLKRNTADVSDSITYMNIRGEKLPPLGSHLRRKHR